MFQKRRSTLGRRHLLGLPQARPTQAVANPETVCSQPSSSWRGRRSEKKRTPSNLNQASRELMAKKRLFNSKSPLVAYMGSYDSQDQELMQRFLGESSRDVTGITMIAATPSSDMRPSRTPMSAHRRRAELEMSRYVPFTLTSSLSTASSKKDPLDELLKTSSTSSHQEKPVRYTSYDFDNLKPPDSPGPSRYNKLILEEKVEQPVDPDLEKLMSLTLEDPNARLQFSPPLSSTCIASPDSGKKITNGMLKESILQSVKNSEKKLSVIKEDLDSSVLEFEQNERTINDLEETVNQSVLDKTLKAVSSSSRKLSSWDSSTSSDNKKTWEVILSHMENDVINRAKEDVKNIRTLRKQVEDGKKNIENWKKTVENWRKTAEHMEKCAMDKFREDLDNIRQLKELKSKGVIEKSTENKENLSKRLSTCKKKEMEDESKWVNSVKSENPCLLKTPNPSRSLNLSAVWTPHSLSQALHDQVNNLYK